MLNYNGQHGALMATAVPPAGEGGPTRPSCTSGHCLWRLLCSPSPLQVHNLVDQGVEADPVDPEHLEHPLARGFCRLSGVEQRLEALPGRLKALVAEALKATPP